MRVVDAMWLFGGAEFVGEGSMTSQIRASWLQEFKRVDASGKKKASGLSSSKASKALKVNFRLLGVAAVVIAPVLSP